MSADQSLLSKFKLHYEEVDDDRALIPFERTFDWLTGLVRRLRRQR